MIKVDKEVIKKDHLQAPFFIKDQYFHIFLVGLSFMLCTGMTQVAPHVIDIHKLSEKYNWCFTLLFCGGPALASLTLGVLAGRKSLQDHTDNILRFTSQVHELENPPEIIAGGYYVIFPSKDDQIPFILGPNNTYEMLVDEEPRTWLSLETFDNRLDYLRVRFIRADDKNKEKMRLTLKFIDDESNVSKDPADVPPYLVEIKGELYICYGKLLLSADKTSVFIQNHPDWAPQLLVQFVPQCISYFQGTSAEKITTSIVEQSTLS